VRVGDTAVLFSKNVTRDTVR